MGNNIDLCELLGLPKEVKCQRCKTKIPSGWEEEDIDCGDHIYCDGLKLRAYCNNCDYDGNEFVVKCTLKKVKVNYD